MQRKDAEKLRKEWGNKPCNHPHIDKLYELGFHTDYVCTQCGEEHAERDSFKYTRQSISKKEEES